MFFFTLIPPVVVQQPFFSVKCNNKFNSFLLVENVFGNYVDKSFIFRGKSVIKIFFVSLWGGGLIVFSDGSLTHKFIFFIKNKGKLVIHRNKIFWLMLFFTPKYGFFTYHWKVNFLPKKIYKETIRIRVRFSKFANEKKLSSLCLDEKHGTF